jgi:hypothetical protein
LQTVGGMCHVYDSIVMQPTGQLANVTPKLKMRAFSSQRCQCLTTGEASVARETSRLSLLVLYE